MDPGRFMAATVDLLSDITRTDRHLGRRTRVNWTARSSRTFMCIRDWIGDHFPEKERSVEVYEPHPVFEASDHTVIVGVGTPIRDG